MSDRQHRVGVVLSGGGVRGAAHIGLLKALSEREIHPSAVAGASSGSLVGAMYAARRSFNQMRDVFRDTDLFSWDYLGLVRKPGLFDSSLLLDLLGKALNQKSFEEIERELHIVATDLLDGSAYYFREGALAKAVLASGAYPGVISPVEHEGKFLSDGGIVNNFPVENLRERCDILIGSFINPVAIMTQDELDSAFAVSQRAFQISTTHAMQSKLSKCDFSIAPLAILDIGLFDHPRTDEAYQIGLDAGRKIADDVAARVEELNGY